LYQFCRDVGDPLTSPVREGERRAILATRFDDVAVLLTRSRFQLVAAGREVIIKRLAEGDSLRFGRGLLGDRIGPAGHLAQELLCEPACLFCRQRSVGAADLNAPHSATDAL